MEVDSPQQAGVAMFLYSAIHVGLKFAIADDDLNSIAAAAMAGALFRSPYGLCSSLVGSGATMVMSGIRATVKIEADCERWSIPLSCRKQKRN
uniref:Uncharacterized protein n=1 Tax=Ditylenchus dipsaci TaxID=166011 RepID=A0A915E007_9BILA